MASTVPEAAVQTHSGDKPAIECGFGCRTDQDAHAAGAAAAADALSTISAHPLSLLLVFASPRYDFAQLLAGIGEVAGEVPVLGASTAGEICNGLRSGSVLVVALASPHLRVRWAIGTGVSQDWSGALERAMTAAEVSRYFDTGLELQRDLAGKGAAVALLSFVPGSTRHFPSAACEIVEALSNRTSGRFPIFGAGTADDWRMQSNCVFAGRQVVEDALLLAVLETELQFGTALVHRFRPGQARAAATRVEGHEVLALEGRVAAEVFSEMLGESRASLHNRHLSLATGRVVGIAHAGGGYVLSLATHFTPRGGLRLSRPVAEGTLLTLMEPEPMLAQVTGAGLIQQAIAHGGVSETALALLHYCALRPRLQGETACNDEIEAMCGVLGNAPLLGFSGFGAAGADPVRYSEAAVAALVIGRRLSPAALLVQEHQRHQRAILQEVQTQAQRADEGTLGLNVTIRS